MMGFRPRMLMSVGFFALTQVLYGPALAAEADQSPSDTLEDIVVMARKRAESLQTAPVSVSAITSVDLESRNIKRIDDLSAVAPGLTITQNTTTVGVSQTTIRGIVNADFNLLNDSPVATYIDGVLIARATGALLATTDLERVEVLRGPQGTLFGRNTTGGAVSLYSRAPAKEFGVQQRLGYGTFNDFTSRTIVDTGAIGPFTSRLTYAHRDYDGYSRNLQTTRSQGIGAVHSNAVLFALHGDLADNFTMDYKFDYDRERDRPGFSQVTGASDLVRAVYGNSVALGGVPLGISPDRQDTVNQTDLGPSLLRVLGHNLTLNYEVSAALKIKSITAYRSVHYTYNTSIGSGPIFANVGRGAQATGFAPYAVGTSDLIDGHDVGRQHQWSQEFQFSGEVARLNYVAGLYYFDENVADVNNGSIAAFVPAVPPFLNPPNFPLTLRVPNNSNYNGGATSYAGYLNVSYTPPIFDDRLELTGGLRYTRDKKFIHQILFDAAGQPIVGPTGFRDLSRRFNNFSQSASVKFQWTQDFMTYFRYSNGYKAGGFNPRSTSASSAAGYAPEKADSFEFGMKSDLLDRHVRLNADIFYTSYNDLQISVIQPDVSVIINNAGKATYKGAEIELTVLPVNGLQLSGSLGYVDPKFKKYVINAVTGLDIADIAKFGSTSKLTTNLRAQYTFTKTAIGNLTMSASWSRLSSRYFGSNPLTSPRIELIKAPAWNNVGAQIGLSEIPVSFLSDNLTVQVYGRNLLNKYQRVDGIDFGPQLGFATNGYGPGRTFGIELIGKF
jgi:iron complex outermembrane receptor protein